MSDGEQQNKVQEQIERYLIDSKIATVGRIRELLLSDEFLDKLSEKIFQKIAWTPFPEKSELDQFCKTTEVSE